MYIYNIYIYYLYIKSSWALICGKSLKTDIQRKLIDTSYFKFQKSNCTHQAKFNNFKHLFSRYRNVTCCINVPWQLLVSQFAYIRYLSPTHFQMSETDNHNHLSAVFSFGLTGWNISSCHFSFYNLKQVFNIWQTFLAKWYKISLKLKQIFSDNMTEIFKFLCSPENVLNSKILFM